MALALTAEDKAWIIDCVNDSLEGLRLTAGQKANANAELTTKHEDAITAAKVVAAAYTGP